MPNEKKLTKAVLVKVVPRNGYLVFKVPTMPGESVTVSLKDWTDTEPPRAGTDTVLEGNLVHHRGGWRANRARYLQPDDRL